MIEAIRKYFLKEVKYTIPKGGMFMWVELPKGMSSYKLFNIAIKENVAFVPGNPFYTEEKDVNTLRLNYTNSDDSMIEEGIKRLGAAIIRCMNEVEDLPD